MVHLCIRLEGKIADNNRHQMEISTCMKANYRLTDSTIQLQTHQNQYIMTITIQVIIGQSSAMQVIGLASRIRDLLKVESLF